MTPVNYHNRYFAPVTTSDNGEVGSATIFHYRQEGHVVWATYQGGSVRFGTLIAQKGEDGELEMRYQHINENSELRSGSCRSVPEVMADGRLRLHERWAWADGGEGKSVIEEIKDSANELQAKAAT